MTVYRANSNCPICNTSEEVWFLKGKVEPLDTVVCTNCEFMFQPGNFISSFIEMKNNSTISSSYVSI